VFIQNHRHEHSVVLMCRVLKASRAGFYAWLDRPPSQRALADQMFVKQIREVHAEFRQNYGTVKTVRELRNKGIACSKHRVARLRRENAIWARRRRRFVVTTRSRHNQPVVPNLLNRCFEAAAPNRIWVGDVTFVPTREGWLYLAVIVDLYSRAVIGWDMGARNSTDLILRALNMAVEGRGPEAGLIHHSDRGQTYASKAYRNRLSQLKMQPSMSRKGDCWDNAVAESFFATLEFELIDQQTFASRNIARTSIFDYIETFYNRKRSHDTNGGRTPLEVDIEYQRVA
jgi:putative transposase